MLYIFERINKDFFLIEPSFLRVSPLQEKGEQNPIGKHFGTITSAMSSDYLIPN